MDPFPTFIPVAWNVTPGAIPADVTSSGSGHVATVRHRRDEVNRLWPAEFILTPAEYQTLLDHYFDALTGFYRFSFNTTTLPATYTPTGYSWVYYAPPQITDTSGPLIQVAVTFECIRAAPRRVAGQLANIGISVVSQGIARAAPWP